MAGCSKHSLQWGSQTEENADSFCLRVSPALGRNDPFIWSPLLGHPTVITQVQTLFHSYLSLALASYLKSPHFTSPYFNLTSTTFWPNFLKLSSDYINHLHRTLPGPTPYWSMDSSTAIQVLTWPDPIHLSIPVFLCLPKNYLQPIWTAHCFLTHPVNSHFHAFVTTYLSRALSQIMTNQENLGMTLRNSILSFFLTHSFL